MFKLEAIINSRDCKFEFLNRSVSIFSEKELILKLDEQKLVKVRALFVDDISGLAIIKIIDEKTNSTLLIKLKFMCNKAVLDIKNAGKDTMILKPKEMIGIVDIRSLGYYKIKVLHHDTMLLYGHLVMTLCYILTPCNDFMFFFYMACKCLLCFPVAYHSIQHKMNPL